MLTRIAITFQSTYLKASSSLMTPNQIMTATPIMPASVLSILLETTTRIVIAKIASVSHCIESMCSP